MITVFGADWPDAVSAGVTVISAPLALWALFQGKSALRAQNASTDIQTVLTLWERLDTHWQRFRAAEAKEQQFEFGQLISYYEIACQLFRSGVLKTEAARTLEEHLDEILPRMQKHSQFCKLFEELKSDEETFADIRWFCARRRPGARSRT